MTMSGKIGGVVDFGRADWSHLGEVDSLGKLPHWSLTKEERGLLAPFIQELGSERGEALCRAVLTIACERGHEGMEALEGALLAGSGPLGLSADAYSDNEERQRAADHAEDWVREARLKVGSVHFGCR